MHTLIRLLLLLTVTGGCSFLRAGNFSAQVPADSFLYIENRDVPGYNKRVAETDLSKKLKDIDWKTMVIQFYHIGLASDEGLGIADEDLLSDEEVLELLGTIESRWQDVAEHLSGDVAFSMGNFKDVVSVFRFNEKIRATLALTYEEDWDSEELTDEQLQQQAKRLEEEAKLDMQELNSILGQFRFWIDVKDSAALETKLFTWLDEVSKSLNEDEDIEDALEVTKTREGELNLYAFGGMDKNLPAMHWAIQNNVWVITFSKESLLESLNLLSNPPADSLANRPSYQEATEFVGAADAIFYWDFAPLDPLIRGILAELPDEESEPIPFVGKLPTGEAVLDWLELDALLPYVIGSKLEADGVHYRGRSGFSRETALSRIAIDPNGSKADIPTFVHRNFGQFSSFNWNLGDGWSRLENELLGIAPQVAAGMGLGRMLASGQVGFDLKLQFLDHLDGNMLVVQSFSPEVIKQMLEASKGGDPAEMIKVQMEHPTGGQNYLFGMGMKNEAAVHEAFDRLMTRFHPEGIPEPVLFEEQELYYPVPADLQGGLFKNLVSYTYLDGYFLLAVGDDQLLKEAVQASKNPALQTKTDPQFIALQAKMMAEPMGLEYSNAAHQKKAIQIIQASMRALQTGNDDIELPDFTFLGELIHQTMEVSTQKGLIMEMEGIVEFPPAK